MVRIRVEISFGTKVSRRPIGLLSQENLENRFNGGKQMTEEISGAPSACSSWESINWVFVEQQVNRLQMRIAKAVKEILAAGVKYTFKRLELCAVKMARTVLRGAGGGNVTGLLDKRMISFILFVVLNDSLVSMNTLTNTDNSGVTYTCETTTDLDNRKETEKKDVTLLILDGFIKPENLNKISRFYPNTREISLLRAIIPGNDTIGFWSIFFETIASLHVKRIDFACQNICSLDRLPQSVEAIDLTGTPLVCLGRLAIPFDRTNVKVIINRRADWTTPARLKVW
jgi:hypothetical protein